MGRRFTLLLAAHLTSAAGNWIYRLTLPLLVLDRTGSALGTGAVYALEYLPYLLFAMPGGALADRFDRWRLLVGGDVAATAVAGSLWLYLASGAQATWPIFVLAFLLACVDPFYQPALVSTVPSLVPRDRLARANARVHVGDYVMTMVGPPVAGAVVLTFGYQTTVAIDAATFAVSALLIAAIGPVGNARTTAAWSLLADIREGLRYVFRRDRVVLAAALVPAVANLGVWLLLANLVYYLSAHRGFTAGEIGVVYGMQGAGAVLGALVGAWSLRRFPPARVVPVALAGGGLSMLALLPATGVAPIGLAWCGQFFSAGIMIVAFVTLRQRIIPGELLGRALATSRMLAFATIPVASLATGLVDNPALVIAVAGTTWLVLAAAAARSPLRTATTVIA